MDRISIDIGNGYVKASNDRDGILHFPTVVRENNDVEIMGESQIDYTIKINDTSYFLGDLAIIKRGTRQFNISKTYNSDTNLYVALCSHILSKTKNSEIELLLGLPYSYYINLNKGQTIIQELEGKQFKTSYKGTEKNIKISNISVYPQGVGAYFYNLYDTNGKAKKDSERYVSSIFIDIGFRTIDVVGFEMFDKKFELIQEDSFSLENYGLVNAINNISNMVLHDTSREVRPTDIEFAIQNKESVISSIYGDIELSKYEIKAYETLAKKIITEINTKNSENLGRYENIFLTGGGASKLYPYMKEMYPAINLQEDNVFCNAKGYLVLDATKTKAK